MIGGVQNIGRVPELQRRILFTLAMLGVYRVGAYVVTPGIDPEVVKNFFASTQGQLFGLFNLFSGGALEQLSIFSLGIMPYISASIIFQLLTVVIPQLEALQKEGEEGRRLLRGLAFVQKDPGDYAWGHPIDQLVAFVDMIERRVVRIIDDGPADDPLANGNFESPELTGALRTDLKPLHITQPEGPSFELDGNTLRWQKWDLHVGFDASHLAPDLDVSRRLNATIGQVQCGGREQIN